ncbi:MAG: cation:proton antiporter subunit C [Verrucomicrobiota bacterium]
MFATYLQLASISAKFNYWIYIILMMIGLFAMIAKNNLIKKLIGMTIFQTAIILFYVSIGVKEGATIPIIEYETLKEYNSQKAGYGAKPDIDPQDYDNPLPHVLMLTAIVVGVSTLGLALAIAQRVFSQFGSLEEDEILEELTNPKPTEEAANG